jgi:NOL1/NOP2/fmu family ribosome biogenesis protein
MAAKPSDCARSVELGDEMIKKYLHGEEVSARSEKGFCAVCYNGITTGFGKASGGTVKNKYPKGLRTL